MDFLRPADAEWGLIGILAAGRELNTERRKALQGLTAADFCDADASRAFAACQVIIARRDRLGLAMLDAELTRSLGAEAAASVMANVSKAATANALNSWQFETFAKAVREGAKRRCLERLAQELARAAADGGMDIDQAIDAARTSLREAVRDGGEWISGTEAAMRAIEAAERNETPIPTGCAALDRVLCGGLMRPELTIVGARPGRGKSAFLQSCALSAARMGKHVAFFSLEMGDVQLGQRLLASASGVSASRQKAGRSALQEADWTALTDGLSLLDAEGSGSFLHFRTAPGLAVERLSAEAANQLDRGELDLLIVDYIQLLRTAEHTRSDFERLGIVSRGLKELALALDIPVLAAAQVRRQDAKGGPLRAPGLDELRGSGDLEQDADVVLLLHAPEAADDDTLRSAPDRLFEGAQAVGCWAFSVDVAKQRQGPNRRVWTVFDPKRMRFLEGQDHV